jgi:hypothetical protein
MSGTKKILLGMLLGSFAASGCMYVTVTPSVQGRAFIVQKKLIGGSSFWNCDATGGTPTCYKVKNVPNGPVSSGGGAAPSETPAASGDATNE